VRIGSLSDVQHTCELMSLIQSPAMRLAGFPIGGASLRRAKVSILCLLAVSLAVAPASVVAKTPHGGPGSAPSCSLLSRVAIANLVGTGSLTLQGKIGNLCEFTGHLPGHYLPMLDIQIEPYFPTVWKAAQSAAMKSAAAQHSTYGRFSSKLFFVSGDKTSEGLPACEEGNTIIGPLQAAPECAGQPELVHFNAIGYGPYRSGSLQLMVSAAVSSQVGDTHLSGVIALVQRLLSGKIH
jgi:hypothetical protein